MLLSQDESVFKMLDIYTSCEIMIRSMVENPYLGARNHHCHEYPLVHEILVGIPSSGDSVQWGFCSVGIPGGNPPDL